MGWSSGVGDERAASSTITTAVAAAAEPATIASSSEPTACATATLASALISTPELFTHSRLVAALVLMTSVASSQQVVELDAHRRVRSRLGGLSKRCKCTVAEFELKARPRHPRVHREEPRRVRVLERVVGWRQVNLLALRAA